MQNTKKPITIKARSNDWDGTFQLMDWWKKDTVSNAKAMVVGAGALGNEVIKNLSLLGFGHILVVDYDIIEYLNLSRSVLFRESDLNRKKGEVALERVKEINPKIKVQYIEGDITSDVGLGIFRQMDVIVGCLDNRLARLAINRACHKIGKTWIDGGIQDLGGHAFVFKPRKTCYECTLTERDRALLEHKLSCMDVAYQHASQGSIATTPISSSIIAAVQVQEALKVVNEEPEHIQMLEEYLYYEGRSNTVLQLKYPGLKDNCPSHYFYENIIEAPLSANNSLKEALEWLTAYTKDESPHIVLDNVLVSEVVAKKSERASKLPQPLPKSTIKDDIIKQYTDLPGEELMLADIITELHNTFPHQDMTLHACGIPPFHIMRVLTDEGEIYVELSADKDHINFE